MNISSIKYFCTQNGPGFRTAVFVSGCTLHCHGCFNQVAWDFNAGTELSDSIIENILQSIEQDEISGLSILGGEPLDPHNQEGVLRIIRAFREKFGDSKTIWLWTGYTEEHIPITEHTDELLSEIDMGVVGPFIEELSSRDVMYAGSSNQKLVEFKKRMAL